MVASMASVQYHGFMPTGVGLGRSQYAATRISRTCIVFYHFQLTNCTKTTLSFPFFFFFPNSIYKVNNSSLFFSRQQTATKQLSEIMPF